MQSLNQEQQSSIFHNIHITVDEVWPILLYRIDLTWPASMLCQKHLNCHKSLWPSFFIFFFFSHAPWECQEGFFSFWTWASGHKLIAWKLHPGQTADTANVNSQQRQWWAMRVAVHWDDLFKRLRAGFHLCFVGFGFIHRERFIQCQYRKDSMCY